MNFGEKEVRGYPTLENIVFISQERVRVLNPALHKPKIEKLKTHHLIPRQFTPPSLNIITKKSHTVYHVHTLTDNLEVNLLIFTKIDSVKGILHDRKVTKGISSAQTIHHNDPKGIEGKLKIELRPRQGLLIELEIRTWYVKISTVKRTLVLKVGR
jgi:hypothetical protein